MEFVLAGASPTATGAFLNLGAHPDALCIDASGLEFGCPLDVAAILATAHWARASMMAVTFKHPANPAVASYLQRMGVPRQLPADTTFLGRPSSDIRTDLRGTVLAATLLTTSNVEEVAEKVGYLVTEFYAPINEHAGKAVFQACGELLDNAAEHGESSVGAYLALQSHAGTVDAAPRLEFALCDTGIGVLQHLRTNSAYAYLTNDDQALRMALKRGVSGAGYGRGNGLTDLVEHTFRQGRLRFELRSGTAQLCVSGPPTAPTIGTSPRIDRTNGTWAWLTHEIHSRK